MSRLRVSHCISCFTLFLWFSFCCLSFILQTEPEFDQLHIQGISLSGHQTGAKYYDVSGKNVVKMRFTSDSTMTKMGFKIVFHF